MSKYTLKELEQQTCSSFGGNNCILHGCMFSCQLAEAKKEALAKEREITKEELNSILQCKK